MNEGFFPPAWWVKKRQELLDDETIKLDHEKHERYIKQYSSEFGTLAPNKPVYAGEGYDYIIMQGIYERMGIL